MQTHGGTAASNAILSQEREFLVRLFVDWNMDGNYDHPMSDMTNYVESAVTDRSLQGNQSEGLMIIEGSAAAELSVTMAGTVDDLSLTGVFSPYQVKSPFWGRDTIGMEVFYDIGVRTVLGITWYRQFIGYVRTITPDRGSNGVTLTALDRVELLRRPVEFPAYAMFGPQRIINGRNLAQLLDPQWVIDHCVRSAGISPTPWRPTLREELGLADDDPTGTQLWISGVGGFVPSIGWLDNWNQHQFPATEAGGPEMYEPYGEPHPDNTTGPYPKNMTGLGTSGNSIHRYWGSDRTRINPVGIQVAGMTMITRGSNATFYQTAADFDVMYIRIGGGAIITLKIGDSGKFWSTWSDGVTTLTSPKVTIPTGGPSQRLVAMWDTFHAGGTPLVWIQAGSNNSGVTWTPVGTKPADPLGNDLLKGQVSIDQRVAMNDIFYVATNFGNRTVPLALSYAGTPATYCAELDAGLNRLSFLPVRKAEDAWEVLSDIASAEFAAVFWGEDGILRFWNQDRLTSLKSDVVKTVTLDEVSGLSITNHLDSVRNIWSLLNAKKMSFDLVAFSASSEDEFYVPAGTRRIFNVNIDDMLSPNPGFVPRFSTTGTYPAWDDDVNWGYVVQWLSGGVWAENNGRTSGIDINAYFNHKGEMEIEIWNGYGQPARLATDNGGPGLRINSTLMVEDQARTTTFKNLGSIAKFRGRNITLDGDWHQEYSDVMGMVSKMLGRTITPNPVTDAITMAGDPRIQLADTIRINDLNGFGERFDVQVYGITRTWSVSGGLSDTYSVELVRPAGSTWDDPVYGIWDDTFMWGV